MAIASAVAWAELVKAMPYVVQGAKTLWEHWSSRRPSLVDAKADLAAQLAEARERIAALEAAEAEHAKITAQLAEQLEAAAKRLGTAYALSVTALVVAAAAVVVAFVK